MKFVRLGPFLVVGVALAFYLSVIAYPQLNTVFGPLALVAPLALAFLGCLIVLLWLISWLRADRWDKTSLTSILFIGMIVLSVSEAAVHGATGTRVDLVVGEVPIPVVFVANLILLALLLLTCSVLRWKWKRELR